jgi:predicted lactoylglutathione lyase
MIKQIFVNLPVHDLKRSVDFFEKLGFSFDSRFYNDQGACLVLGENIFAMLLVKPFFQQFTKKKIADATQTTEVLLAVDLPTRQAVDELVKKAVDAGGSTYMEPQDHGWMYQNSFADLDGHQWEIFFSDESLLPS